ncbi:unnamed protein product [Cuscuta campestris]|uniref:Uncharacterized protein n=1 Tax=Cuscuta campestris TaxID=132261 RepID=A0A484K830_9ASTE|nr:unnamed protein product [Cuscuta campestris]
MKGAFNSRGSHWLTKRFMNARNKNKKPKFIGTDHWGVMLQYWASPEFRVKSEKSNKNRNTEKAKQRQYYGGRRSVREHVKKREMEDKVVPTQLKIINRLFVKKGAEPSEEVAQIKEKLVQKKQAVSRSDSNSMDVEDIADEELEDDLGLYVDVVGRKKNRIFGQGCEAGASGSFSSGGPSHEDYAAILKKELEEKFEAKSAALEKKYEAQSQDLLTQFQGLKESFTLLTQGYNASVNSTAAPTPNVVRPFLMSLPRSPSPLLNNTLTPAYFFASQPLMSSMPMPMFHQSQVPSIISNNPVQEVPEENNHENCDVASFLN